MRKPIVTAFVCLSLAPAGANAQYDDDVGGDEVEMPVEGSARVAAPDDGAQASAPAPTASQHTVERGDTLWDLSQRYLGSPWYWPKVWSYNPEIANPHWIYPGNLVRFLPTGEEVPTQVEVGPQQTPDVDEGEMMDDRVQVTGDIGFRVRPALAVMSPGFVTSHEVEESGRIAGSFGESEMIAVPQQVYLEFASAGRAKLGETYIVYRNRSVVTHPTTNEPIGIYTQLLGQVRIVAIDAGGMATASIVLQDEPFLRGDLIGPSGESMQRLVAARPNEREIKGATVCGAPNRALVHFGEGQTMIIDKGSDDGVKNGNVFTIWRQHDGLAQDNILNPSRIEERWPKEVVGECVAFEVKSNATVCLVSWSIRELVRGDHAEVRVAGARASR